MPKILQTFLLILLASALTTASIGAAPMPCGQDHAGDSSAGQDFDPVHAAMGHETSHDMGHGITHDAADPGTINDECCPDCPSSCTSATGVTLLTVTAGYASAAGIGPLLTPVPEGAIAAGAPNLPYRPPNVIH